MAASNPDGLLDARKQMADSDEPLLTRRRSVQNYGSGATLYVNPTAEAAEIVGFDDQDDMVVDVYDSHIELRPADD